MLGVGLPLLETWFMSDSFLESSAAVLHIAWLLAGGAVIAGMARRGCWGSGARGTLLIGGSYLAAGFLLTALLSALPSEGGGIWRWLLVAFEYCCAEWRAVLEER